MDSPRTPRTPSQTSAGDVRTAEWAAAPRRGIDGFIDDLARQRTLMQARSAVYLKALQQVRAIVDGALGDGTIVAKLERTWKERAFLAYYDRPLLLLAALRQDAIAEGPRHPLWRAFAADTPDESAVTREAIVAAMSPTRLSLWLTLATRRVQTNEVSRAVAWLWPALLAGCDGGKRPLAIFDVGASAGLNLVADALPAPWVDETRQPLPVVTRVSCVQRVGFEPHAIDVRSDDDVAWMRACLWPGETKRHARFEAAVGAMRAAYAGPEPRPRMLATQAHMVPTRLESLGRTIPSDALLLVYQTLVRGYLEPDKREAYEHGMRQWIASLPPGRACWIALELAEEDEGESEGHPAELVANVRVDGDVKALRLARCGYHPHEIVVDAAGGNEFVRRMKG